MPSVLSSILVFLVISYLVWRRFLRWAVNSAFGNIPGPPSASFVKGNLGQMFNPNAWEFLAEISERYGGIVKYHGFFGNQQLYVSDSTALHHIILKDQDIYEEPGWIIESNRMSLGKSLLGTLGDHHRKQRKMLNPAFSPSHLRDMMPIFYEVTNKLCDAIALKVKDGPCEVDILHWTSRTALELIGQSGLGYSFDKFDDSPPHPYTEALNNFLPTLYKFAIPRQLSHYIAKIGTPAFRRRLVHMIPSRNAQKLREIIDFMHQTSVEILASKKIALRQGDDAVHQQVGRGKDIMSILLKANMSADKADRIDESELLAQMSTLIFAATDTTSAAIARILHVLASHPDVQIKLRQEVRQSRMNGDLDYDELCALPYLDAVMRETLRLYPPVVFVPRTCRKDTVLPLANPIIGVDGNKMNEIFVPDGTNLLVGILAANRSLDLWGPDAYEWKPERWLSPLPTKLTDAHPKIPGVYSNMMTFIGGGRACIGFKFSQLEMKVVLSLLLESFTFSLTDKEIIWNLGGATTPSLKDDPVRQLPLVVTPIAQVA